MQFRQIITSNTELNRVQANITDAIKSSSSVFTKGNLVTADVDPTANPSGTVVNHGLRKVPEIWTLTDQNTNTNVWRLDWTENTITLQAGASCHISFWVA